jgi:hypothetical protein
MDQSSLSRHGATTTGQLTGPEAGPAGSEPTRTGRRADRSALGLALPGLWLVTAVGLVVTPFLTLYRDLMGYTDRAIQNGTPDVQLENSVNGWGQWDGRNGGHDIRIGILLVVVAGLLILAAAAAIGWRRARWPVWLGLPASAMAVAATVLSLVELEAIRYLRELGDATFRSDVTLGPGAWLTAVLGGLAAAAVVLSLVRIRRSRLGAFQRPTPAAPLADRMRLALPGLWVVAAIGLAVAPFLTVYRVDAVDIAAHVDVDGWGRTEGSLGIPCVILAAGLLVAAIAMTVRPAAALPLQIGLLAGTAKGVVGAFLLLKLDSLREIAGPSLTVSTGIGTWLVLAAGVLAVATVVLASVHQQAPEVD